MENCFNSKKFGSCSESLLLTPDSHGDCDYLDFVSVHVDCLSCSHVDSCETVLPLYEMIGDDCSFYESSLVGDYVDTVESGKIVV